MKTFFDVPYFKDIFQKVEREQELDPIEKFIWDTGFYSRKVDEESFRRRFSALIIYIKLKDFGDAEQSD